MEDEKQEKLNVDTKLLEGEKGNPIPNDSKLTQQSSNDKKGAANEIKEESKDASKVEALKAATVATSSV